MPKREVLVKFGLAVRRVRKALGMSQEELGFRANLHRTYIGMIERAEKNLTITSMNKLADGLGTTISELTKDL